MPDFGNRNNDYSIELAFFPFKEPMPSFNLYRKLRPSSDSYVRDDDTLGSYKLPAQPSDEEWSSYVMRLSAAEGFEIVEIDAHQNPMLTIQYLSALLKAWSKVDAAEYADERDLSGFWKEISFNMINHSEGREQLIVQPYYFKAEQRFGFLLDFHFRLNSDQPFNRRVQQLSLSLNSYGQRNKNFYIDRLHKITTFADKIFSGAGGRWTIPSLPGFVLEKKLLAIRAEREEARVFVFSGSNTGRSQFKGIQDQGPVKVAEPVNLVFCFVERDRQLAREVVAGLLGKNQRFSQAFKGYEGFFRSKIAVDGNPVVLPDYSERSIDTILQRVVDEPNSLPVLVLPKDEENAYLYHKAIFVRQARPTQVVTTDLIRNPSQFKWALSNIALQIFCKTGGIPWKLKPQSENCLIIGVSQAHQVSETGVKKYLAFSVLTDSTGMFQKIEVLSQERTDEREYLQEFKVSLQKLLRDEGLKYGRIVLHTSFSLKKKEMHELEDAVRECASSAEVKDVEFAVVKVNSKHRFFGVNPAENSLVPYDSTVARIGPREYLIWFEGIYPDKKTVSKDFPSATHIKIIYSSPEFRIKDHELIRDLINLSGANWRGFNARSSPISVFYCHLVAGLVRDFQTHGYPVPAVEVVRPWFL